MILVRKAKNEKMVNIDQKNVYLKSQYLAHNAEERTFIPNIPGEENLYELMSVAPQFMNCRLNVTYFFKNHEIIFKYFDEETQTPWKHAFFFYM